MAEFTGTPGPWYYENVEDREDRSAHGVVKDDKDRILFDTLNSDVATINTEYDEGSVYRWDEQARLNLTLAAAAPDLLAACEAFHRYLLTCAAVWSSNNGRVVELNSGGAVTTAPGLDELAEAAAQLVVAAIAKAKGTPP